MSDDEKAHCEAVADQLGFCGESVDWAAGVIAKERSDAAAKARAGAYEEAAKVCDAMFDASEYPDGVMVGMAAERIRALAKQAGEP